MGVRRHMNSVAAPDGIVSIWREEKQAGAYPA